MDWPRKHKWQISQGQIRNTANQLLTISGEEKETAEYNELLFSRTF